MKRFPSNISKACALTAVCALVLPSVASAQQRTSGTASTTQLWIDVSTTSMAGLDDMPMAGLLGGMMGNSTGTFGNTGKDGRRAKGVGNFGETRYGSLGRRIDVALYSPQKPGGSATHTVPFSGLGYSPLQLVTPPREGLIDGEGLQFEKPRGRILFYWGCSDAIRAGQPRIFDMAKLSERDYNQFVEGRSVRDRGARADPGHAIWPNDQQNSRVEKDASIVGEHTVRGDGVPANMNFRLEQDFMQRMQVQSQGGLNDAIRLNWGSVPNARAYFLTAMGGSGGRGSDSLDMVIWSSSEPPESGMGLMDYISNPNVDKWVGERVLLSSQTTQCAIPAGIFKDSQGAMLQALAYGNEVNLAQSKPQGAPNSWRPEWAVRARYKSLTMVPLGEESRGGQRGRAAQNEKKEESPNPIKGVGDALKGLFGR